MSTPIRLLGFAAVLVIAFFASFGVGRAVGPEPVEQPAPAHDMAPGSDHP